MIDIKIDLNQKRAILCPGLGDIRLQKKYQKKLSVKLKKLDIERSKQKRIKKEETYKNKGQNYSDQI